MPRLMRIALALLGFICAIFGVGRPTHPLAADRQEVHDIVGRRYR